MDDYSHYIPAWDLKTGMTADSLIDVARIVTGLTEQNRDELRLREEDLAPGIVTYIII
ncbi:hypothetical protein ACFLVC_02360 [Chloroflexota bacterium]